MNICLVGLNNNLVKQTAKELAAELNYDFLDLQNELNKYILKTTKYSLLIADEILQNTETELVKSSSNKQNVVIFMPNDMFLSNKNYKFVSSDSFAICTTQISNLKLNLQKLICQHCKYVVEGDNPLQAIKNILNL